MGCHDAGSETGHVRFAPNGPKVSSFRLLERADLCRLHLEAGHVYMAVHQNQSAKNAIAGNSGVEDLVCVETQGKQPQ